MANRRSPSPFIPGAWPPEDGANVAQMDSQPFASTAPQHRLSNDLSPRTDSLSNASSPTTPPSASTSFSMATYSPATPTRSCKPALNRAISFDESLCHRSPVWDASCNSEINDNISLCPPDSTHVNLVHDQTDVPSLCSQSLFLTRQLLPSPVFPSKECSPLIDFSPPNMHIHTPSSLPLAPSTPPITEPIPTISFSPEVIATTVDTVNVNRDPVENIAPIPRSQHAPSKWKKLGTKLKSLFCRRKPDCVISRRSSVVSNISVTVTGSKRTYRIHIPNEDDETTHRNEHSASAFVHPSSPPGLALPSGSTLPSPTIEFSGHSSFSPDFAQLSGLPGEPILTTNSVNPTFEVFSAIRTPFSTPSRAPLSRSINKQRNRFSLPASAGHTAA